MLLENQAMDDDAMDRQEIEDELKRLIREARGEPDDGDDQTTAEVEERIDSLEGVEVIMAAEERFGVSIPDGELNRICRSISRIAELVEKQLAAAATDEAGGAAS
jgi:acyl carrier protein